MCKATCIWKFVQHHFIASELNAGCGGYLDNIYNIHVDILDLKAGFPLANFVIPSNFFCSIIVRLIKLKLLCETLKKEKFLLDIQTKCDNIANKILNAAIDAEQTLKCKWPKKSVL